MHTYCYFLASISQERSLISSSFSSTYFFILLSELPENIRIGERERPMFPQLAEKKNGLRWRGAMEKIRITTIGCPSVSCIIAVHVRSRGRRRGRCIENDRSSANESLLCCLSRASEIDLSCSQNSFLPHLVS